METWQTSLGKKKYELLFFFFWESFSNFFPFKFEIFHCVTCWVIQMKWVRFTLITGNLKSLKIIKGPQIPRRLKKKQSRHKNNAPHFLTRTKNDVVKHSSLSKNNQHFSFIILRPHNVPSAQHTHHPYHFLHFLVSSSSSLVPSTLKQQ